MDTILKKLAERIEPIKTTKHVTVALIDCKPFIFGYAQMKTHPLQKEFSKNPDALFLHAEVHAIARALKHIDDFSKYNLYVYRRMSDGRQGLSKPCIGCTRAIKHFNFSQAYYSTNKEDCYERLY